MCVQVNPSWGYYTHPHRDVEKREGRSWKEEVLFFFFVWFLSEWFFFFQVRNHAACTNDAAIVALYTHSCVHSWDLFSLLLFLDSLLVPLARTQSERDGQREAQIGLDHLTVVVCVYTATLFSSPTGTRSIVVRLDSPLCQCCSAQLAECLRPFAGIKRRLISLLDDGFLSFFVVEPLVFILWSPGFISTIFAFSWKFLQLYIFMAGRLALVCVHTFAGQSVWRAARWIWMDFRPGQNLKITTPGFQVINKFTLRVWWAWSILWKSLARTRFESIIRRWILSNLDASVQMSPSQSLVPFSDSHLDQCVSAVYQRLNYTHTHTHNVLM